MPGPCHLLAGYGDALRKWGGEWAGSVGSAESVITIPWRALKLVVGAAFVGESSGFVVDRPDCR